MPYVGTDFTPADASEEDFFAFDFTNDLGDGDSISSTSWTCAVAPTSEVNDPTPDNRLIGPSSVIDNKSIQKVGTLVEGVTYILTAEVVTESGAQLSLWSHVTCGSPW